MSINFSIPFTIINKTIKIMSELSSGRLLFTWSHGFPSCCFSERLIRFLMALVGGTAGLENLEDFFWTCFSCHLKQRQICHCFRFHCLVSSKKNQWFSRHWMSKIFSLLSFARNFFVLKSGNSLGSFPDIFFVRQFLCLRYILAAWWQNNYWFSMFYVLFLKIWKYELLMDQSDCSNVWKSCEMKSFYICKN